LVVVPDASPPADLEQVRAAFRLGWAVAELRGRYRPDLFLHPEPDAPPAFRRAASDQPLPLANERKNQEVRIEVFQAAAGLSDALDLHLKTKGTPTLERIHDVTARLEKTNNANRRSRWPTVAQAFYDWDAQLQDALVVNATRAAGYQLGRAFGETSWALDPERPDHEMGSWVFLFGSQREETVKRLLARLSTYLGPLVVAAVEGSFEAWSGLARDPDRRGRRMVRRKLYEQGLLWRDLIRGERQPLDLAPPTATSAWKEVAVYSKAVDALKAPLIAGGCFAALFVIGGALLVNGAKYPWLTSSVSIFGAIGLTSAGLYARAKAELTSLLADLRLAVDEQRVRQVANLCPAPTAHESATS
jgi:hypothetical protein